MPGPRHLERQLRAPAPPARSTTCRPGLGEADPPPQPHRKHELCVTQPPRGYSRVASQSSQAGTQSGTRLRATLPGPYPCARTQQLLHTAAARLRLPDPRPHTPRPRLRQPTSLLPARPAHYWRELVAGTTSSREGPTRNVPPLAPAGPPDFGALRARGKLLLPFGPCVTSVATLRGRC